MRKRLNCSWQKEILALVLAQAGYALGHLMHSASGGEAQHLCRACERFS
eukprot:COSAG02_NODE_60162_length_272_cov_0.595376_1_plen_48_part_01